jgi:hypothetical protein
MNRLGSDPAAKSGRQLIQESALRVEWEDVWKRRNPNVITIAATSSLVVIVAACSEPRSIVSTMELTDEPSFCEEPSFSLGENRWRSTDRLSLEESLSPLAGDLVIFDNETATLTLESGRVLGFEIQRGFTNLECRIPS